MRVKRDEKTWEKVLNTEMNIAITSHLWITPNLLSHTSLGGSLQLPNTPTQLASRDWKRRRAGDIPVQTRVSV